MGHPATERVVVSQASKREAHLSTSPALVRSKAESPKPAIVRGALSSDNGWKLQAPLAVLASAIRSRKHGQFAPSRWFRSMPSAWINRGGERDLAGAECKRTRFGCGGKPNSKTMPDAGVGHLRSLSPHILASRDAKGLTGRGSCVGGLPRTIGPGTTGRRLRWRRQTGVSSGVSCQRTTPSAVMQYSSNDPEGSLSARSAATFWL